MIMILQFKDDMEKRNNFFRKVTSSPIILWNASAALIFVTLGAAILIKPSLMGTDRSLGMGFGGILTIYGVFRFWTFYQGIKDKGND